MALPDNLLSDTKNYLDITWQDEATDLKVTGMIERGMKYIDGIAGSSQDYTIEDKPKEILLDYCRYARSNALETFHRNYLHELLTLQIMKGVEVYEEQNPDI